MKGGMDKWWIRGFEKTDAQGVKDSVVLGRQVSVVAHDTASQVFSFHLLDTVLNLAGQRTLRDTLVEGRSGEGFGFSFTAPVPDALPFDWALDTPIRKQETWSYQAWAVSES